MKRIVHVTTVHPRDDIRIFRKECVSLARAGYEVVQVVGDGQGDATIDGVRIVDIGVRPASRLVRMRMQPARALATVRELKPALVHVHDPELLPLAAAMQRDGIPAIYDAHEDVPRQILTKQWIPAPLRRPLAWAFERYENAQVGRLAGLVAATPHIAERYAGLDKTSRAHTLVIEPSRDGRDALTADIRQALVQTGALSGPAVTVESLVN